MTACHNLFQTTGAQYQSFALCKLIIQGKSMSHIEVSVVHYNEGEDWAILSPTDANIKFHDHIEICKFTDLPGSDEAANKFIRVIHAPCGLYIEEPGTLELTCTNFDNIYGYRPDTNPAMKSTLVTPSSSTATPLSTREESSCKWITVANGLHSGACGSPYLDSNHRVVALHIWSCNEAKPLIDVIRSLVQKSGPKKRKHADIESTEAHCNVKEGIVLCKIPGFVQFLRTLLRIDINPTIS